MLILFTKGDNEGVLLIFENQSIAYSDLFLNNFVKRWGTSVVFICDFLNL